MINSAQQANPIASQNTVPSVRRHLPGNLIAILLIVLTAGGVYLNTLKAPFIFDDIRFIVENPEIKDIARIIRLAEAPRPLTFLTFALNHYIGGLNTAGYHAFNIFLHILFSVLTFFLARTVFRSSGSAPVLPLFTALLVSCHPVNTEVVSYIFNRASSLSAVFCVLSLLLYLRAADGSRKLYYLSLMSFVLAFLSKETAVVLPGLIIALDYFFISDCSLTKVIKKKYYFLPFLAGSAVMLLLQYHYFKPLEKTNIANLWPGYSYYLTQPRIMMKYLRLLVLPTGLCIDHRFTPVRSVTESGAILPFLFIAGLLAAFRKIYIRYFKRSRVMLFGLIWLIVGLFPTFVVIAHTGERHLYLPGIGFALLICGAIAAVSASFPTEKKTTLTAILIIPLIAFGVLTVKRNELYKDPLLIWKDAISKYPSNADAYLSLALEYHARGDLAGAIENYDKSLCLAPGYAQAYYNRGLAHQLRGDNARALADYDRAIELESEMGAAYNNRGVVNQALGETARAKADYDKALMLSPGNALAYYNRAILYFKEKKYENSWSDIRKAQALNHEIDPAFLAGLTEASGK